MTRCLRDRTLLLVHYGEGHATQRAHLAACGRCAARYRRVVGDLELISGALERMPTAVRVRRPTRAPWRRRVAVAAALWAVVMVAGLEMWLWRETQVLLPAQRPLGEADTLRFLAEVSAGLSSPSDDSEGESPLRPPGPDLAEPTRWPGGWGDNSLVQRGATCTQCDTVDDDIVGGDGDENI